MPALKSGEISGAETRHTLTYTFDLFFPDQFLLSLGKEKIGVSDDDLFQRLRNYVTKRQREVLGKNIGGAETDADMALTDQGMTWPAFAFEEFPPLIAVRQVRKIAMATNGWGMDKADADIMEQGCFFDKGKIECFAAGKAACHCQSFVCHSPTMSKENLPRRIAGGIIFFQ